MRIAGHEGEIMGAMIPNRETGDALKERIMKAIGARLSVDDRS